MHSSACKIIQRLMWANVTWLFPEVSVQNNFNTKLLILKLWAVESKNPLIRIFTFSCLSGAKKFLAILGTSLPAQNAQAEFGDVNSSPNHHIFVRWFLNIKHTKRLGLLACPPLECHSISFSPQPCLLSLSPINAFHCNSGNLLKLS